MYRRDVKTTALTACRASPFEGRQYWHSDVIALHQAASDVGEGLRICSIARVSYFPPSDLPTEYDRNRHMTDLQRHVRGSRVDNDNPNV